MTSIPEPLKALVDALPEPCLLCSSRGRALAANRAAREALGVPTLVGLELGSFTDQPDALDDLLRFGARTREPRKGILRLRRGDGQIMAYASTASLLVPPEGKRASILLVRFTLRDANDPFLQLNQTIAQLTNEIRRRRDAEARLRALHDEMEQQSEQRFRLLVESVKDYAIFMLDTEGRIASWNAGAERIKGYRAGDIIGRHFSVFYRKEEVDAGKCERVLALAAAEGRFEEEGERVRKDGALFHAHVLITAIRRDGDGLLVGYAKVTRDLTERDRYEGALLERARAEEARRAAEQSAADIGRLAEDLRLARDRAEEITRLKDEFLATLSHELRTPLSAIVGWSQLLQSGALTTEEKRAHAIATIQRNALAQSRLIDDLLDVSRIISGKFRLEVGEVDVNQIVAAALDVVRPAAEAKGVHLGFAFSSEAGQVSGDASRLQQVLWNLFTNAVKFTPKAGHVHATLRRERSSVVIEVIDSGAGIAADFLPHVFGRFSQQSQMSLDVSQRHLGGLGLGLAIVKHIVELHGGTVRAESAGDGKGSKFTVELPVPGSAGQSLPPATSALLGAPALAGPASPVTCPPELDGLGVLVVDDDPDARDLIQTVLERCGAKVVTAPSVAEAFEVLQAQKPDVIVSDIGMPGEDGYAFIRALRAMPRERGGRIPAVALTAFARAEDRRKALVAGFQNHTAKPIEPQELLLVIASLAGRIP